MATNSKNHHWRFFRAGGVDQPRLDTGADLLAIETLDQKLWIALSCPVKGLELDERTLALIDTDKDGRVRAQELIGAVRWVGRVLRETGDLAKGADSLPLASINDDDDDGQKLLSASRHILEELGKADAEEISLQDVIDTQKNFKNLRWNGDGVVPPESVADAGLKEVAKEIIAAVGGEPDKSGLTGVSQAKIDAFFKELADFDAWTKKGEADAAKIFALGPKTAEAVTAMALVRAKIDDYFTRSRVAAYDPRSLAAVNRQEDEYLALAARDMSITAQEIAGFPLARIEPGKALPLVGPVNPAWSEALAKFKTVTAAPCLGSERATLTEVEWKEIKEKLAPFEAWNAEKKGAAVEKLGIEKIRALLAGKTKDQITALVVKDKAVAVELDAVVEVERILRYQRDLFIILNNFVSFTDFYSRRRKAVFQAGTLYLDGRSCELCVRVDDAGKHSTMAIMAKTYIAYCECSRPSSNEKMTVACAFTAGDSDNLMVGRNGIFYDRKGRDWDATITKIIENPISIGQAFWAPYKRTLRWIEEQIAKRAAAADAAATDKLTKTAGEVGDAASTGKANAEPKKFDFGILAAVGLAVSGITAIFGTMMNAFFGLGPWMPAGVVGVILLISGPSMLIAWMKLRQRNLGPILDANGWAVNSRVKINIPLGATLTATASLPDGAERSLVDPYAEKRSVWPKIILWLVILGGLGWGAWQVKYVREKVALGYTKVTGKAFPFDIEKKEEPKSTAPDKGDPKAPEKK